MKDFCWKKTEYDDDDDDDYDDNDVTNDINNEKMTTKGLNDSKDLKDPL